jgi:hypothetical protein
MTRIAVSITTLPSRLDGLKKVLTSLLKQSRIPDAIYLNIPYETMKGLKYNDEKIHSIEEMSSLIKINRCDDMGPITKLLPVLYLETAANTIIITFDDDNYVGPDVIKLFLRKSRQYPDSCLSFSGWCIGQFPFYYQLISDNKVDVEVDWLQGCHGILYRRCLVDPDELINFRTDLPSLDHNDDHRISAYLTCPKISIGYSATEHFFSIGNGHLDAISGGDGFTREVMNISWKFKEDGIYYHNHDSRDSVIYIPIIIVIVIILIFAIWILGGVNHGMWIRSLHVLVPLAILVLIVTGIYILNRCQKLRMKSYSK